MSIWAAELNYQYLKCGQVLVVGPDEKLLVFGEKKHRDNLTIPREREAEMKRYLIAQAVREVRE